MGAVAALSFTLLKCYEHPFPNTHTSMNTNPEVLCGEKGEWMDSLVIAIIAILLYVVIANVVTCFIISRAPSRFHLPRFRRRWKFLFIKVRPEAFWWMQVLNFKGVLINILLCIFTTGVNQIWAIALVIVAYLLGVVVLFPWRHKWVNYLDILVNIVLVLVSTLSASFAVQGRNLEKIDADSSEEDTMTDMLIIAGGSPVLCGIVLKLAFLHKQFTAWDKDGKTAINMECKILFEHVASAPPEKYNTFAKDLTDSDVTIMKNARHLLMTEFMGLQESCYPWRMRLITNTENQALVYNALDGPNIRSMVETAKGDRSKAEAIAALEAERERLAFQIAELRGEEPDSTDLKEPGKPTIEPREVTGVVTIDDVEPHAWIIKELTPGLSMSSRP